MITAKEKIKEVLDKEYVSSTEEKKEQVAAKLVEALGLNNAKYMTEEDMKSGGSFNPKETCDSRMKKVARENINLLEERLKLCSRHGLIIANPGEGKHFVAKKEIETILKNTWTMFSLSTCSMTLGKILDTYTIRESTWIQTHHLVLIR